MALEVTIYTSAANMLPIPGGVITRLGGMRARGVGMKQGSWMVLLFAGVWAGAAFLLSGFAILLRNALLGAPKDEIFAITSDGVVSRTKASEGRRAQRQTMGVRWMNLPDGVNVVATARNADYPRVLDRYIARLGSMRQPAQALTPYRREIDRNPNDPGLYERLAAFLEQNKMTGEIEAT